MGKVILALCSTVTLIFVLVIHLQFQADSLKGNTLSNWSDPLDILPNTIEFQPGHFERNFCDKIECKPPPTNAKCVAPDDKDMTIRRTDKGTKANCCPTFKCFTLDEKGYFTFNGAVGRGPYYYSPYRDRNNKKGLQEDYEGTFTSGPVASSCDSTSCQEPPSDADCSVLREWDPRLPTVTGENSKCCRLYKCFTKDGIFMFPFHGLLGKGSLVNVMDISTKNLIPELGNTDSYRKSMNRERVKKLKKRDLSLNGKNEKRDTTDPFGGAFSMDTMMFQPPSFSFPGTSGSSLLGDSSIFGGGSKKTSTTPSESETTTATTEMTTNTATTEATETSATTEVTTTTTATMETTTPSAFGGLFSMDTNFMMQPPTFSFGGSASGSSLLGDSSIFGGGSKKTSPAPSESETTTTTTETTTSTETPPETATTKATAETTESTTTTAMPETTTPDAFGGLFSMDNNIMVQPPTFSFGSSLLGDSSIFGGSKKTSSTPSESETTTTSTETTTSTTIPETTTSTTTTPETTTSTTTTPETTTSTATPETTTSTTTPETTTSTTTPETTTTKETTETTTTKETTETTTTKPTMETTTTTATTETTPPNAFGSLFSMDSNIMMQPPTFSFGPSVPGSSLLGDSSVFGGGKKTSPAPTAPTEAPTTKEAKPPPNDAGDEDYGSPFGDSSDQTSTTTEFKATTTETTTTSTTMETTTPSAFGGLFPMDTNIMMQPPTFSFGPSVPSSSLLGDSSVFGGSKQSTTASPDEIESTTMAPTEVPTTTEPNSLPADVGEDDYGSPFGDSSGLVNELSSRPVETESTTTMPPETAVTTEPQTPHTDIGEVDYGPPSGDSGTGSVEESHPSEPTPEQSSEPVAAPEATQSQPQPPSSDIGDTDYGSSPSGDSAGAGTLESQAVEQQSQAQSNEPVAAPVATPEETQPQPPTADIGDTDYGSPFGESAGAGSAAESPSVEPDSSQPNEPLATPESQPQLTDIGDTDNGSPSGESGSFGAEPASAQPNEPIAAPMATPEETQQQQPTADIGDTDYGSPYGDSAGPGSDAEIPVVKPASPQPNEPFATPESQPQLTDIGDTDNGSPSGESGSVGAEPASAQPTEPVATPETKPQSTDIGDTDYGSPYGEAAGAESVAESPAEEPTSIQPNEPLTAPEAQPQPPSPGIGDTEYGSPSGDAPSPVQANEQDAVPVATPEPQPQQVSTDIGDTDYGSPHGDSAGVGVSQVAEELQDQSNEPVPAPEPTPETQPQPTDTAPSGDPGSVGESPAAEPLPSSEQPVATPETQPQPPSTDIGDTDYGSPYGDSSGAESDTESPAAEPAPAQPTEPVATPETEQQPTDIGENYGSPSGDSGMGGQSAAAEPASPQSTEPLATPVATPETQTQQPSTDIGDTDYGSPYGDSVGAGSVAESPAAEPASAYPAEPGATPVATPEIQPQLPTTDIGDTDYGSPYGDSVGAASVVESPAADPASAQPSEPVATPEIQPQPTDIGDTDYGSPGDSAGSGTIDESQAAEKPQVPSNEPVAAPVATPETQPQPIDIGDTDYGSHTGDSGSGGQSQVMEAASAQPTEPVAAPVATPETQPIDMGDTDYGGDSGSGGQSQVMEPASAQPTESVATPVATPETEPQPTEIGNTDYGSPSGDYGSGSQSPVAESASAQSTEPVPTPLATPETQTQPPSTDIGDTDYGSPYGDSVGAGSVAESPAAEQSSTQPTEPMATPEAQPQPTDIGDTDYGSPYGDSGSGGHSPEAEPASTQPTEPVATPVTTPEAQPQPTDIGDTDYGSPSGDSGSGQSPVTEMASTKPTEAVATPEAQPQPTDIGDTDYGQAGPQTEKSAPLQASELVATTQTQPPPLDFGDTDYGSPSGDSGAGTVGGSQAAEERSQSSEPAKSKATPQTQPPPTDIGNTHYESAKGDSVGTFGENIVPGSSSSQLSEEMSAPKAKVATPESQASSSNRQNITVPGTAGPHQAAVDLGEKVEYRPASTPQSLDIGEDDYGTSSGTVEESDAKLSANQLKTNAVTPGRVEARPTAVDVEIARPSSSPTLLEKSESSTKTKNMMQQSSSSLETNSASESRIQGGSLITLGGSQGSSHVLMSGSTTTEGSAFPKTAPAESQTPSSNQQSLHESQATKKTKPDVPLKSSGSVPSMETNIKQQTASSSGLLHDLGGAQGPSPAPATGLEASVTPLPPKTTASVEPQFSPPNSQLLHKPETTSKTKPDMLETKPSGGSLSVGTSVKQQSSSSFSASALASSPKATVQPAKTATPAPQQPSSPNLQLVDKSEATTKAKPEAITAKPSGESVSMTTNMKQQASSIAASTSDSASSGSSFNVLGVSQGLPPAQISGSTTAVGPPISKTATPAVLQQSYLSLQPLHKSEAPTKAKPEATASKPLGASLSIGTNMKQQTPSSSGASLASSNVHGVGGPSKVLGTQGSSLVPISGSKVAAGPALMTTSSAELYQPSPAKQPPQKSDITSQTKPEPIGTKPSGGLPSMGSSMKQPSFGASTSGSSFLGGSNVLDERQGSSPAPVPESNAAATMSALKTVTPAKAQPLSPNQQPLHKPESTSMTKSETITKPSIGTNIKQQTSSSFGASAPSFSPPAAGGSHGASSAQSQGSRETTIAPASKTDATVKPLPITTPSGQGSVSHEATPATKAKPVASPVTFSQIETKASPSAPSGVPEKATTKTPEPPAANPFGNMFGGMGMFGGGMQMGTFSTPSFSIGNPVATNTKSDSFGILGGSGSKKSGGSDMLFDANDILANAMADMPPMEPFSMNMMQPSFSFGASTPNSTSSIGIFGGGQKKGSSESLFDASEILKAAKPETPAIDLSSMGAEMMKMQSPSFSSTPNSTSSIGIFGGNQKKGSSETLFDASEIMKTAKPETKTEDPFSSIGTNLMAQSSSLGATSPSAVKSSSSSTGSQQASVDQGSSSGSTVQGNETKAVPSASSVEPKPSATASNPFGSFGSFNMNQSMMMQPMELSFNFGSSALKGAKGASSADIGNDGIPDMVVADSDMDEDPEEFQKEMQNMMGVFGK